MTPNSIGIFLITVLNTNSIDQIFESRKVIGALHPKSNLVENSHSEFCEKEINKDSLTVGEFLSIEQQSELKNILNEFSEIFTTNSMKPKQISVLKHRIITNNALPQFRKSYPIPYAFEKEVDKQINEMIENDIIRLSISPWNAPVIKRRDKKGYISPALDTRCDRSDGRVSFLDKIRRRVGLLVYAFRRKFERKNGIFGAPRKV